MRNKFIIAIFVAITVFVVFLPALGNEFINWDDEVYVYENPFIRSLDIGLLQSAFLGFYAGNWHPFTWISHALDYAIWGLDPLGHHLTNNILHAFNTFLVVLLMVRLLASRQAGMPTSSRISRFTLLAAATTGLLFGLHPIHVESVAWVAERKDLLCAFFFLLSVMAYVKYAGSTFLSFPLGGNLSGAGVYMGNDPGQAGMTKPILRHLSKWYFLSLFFFILALMSKPMAVTLPFVLLLLDWYPLKRVRAPKDLITLFAGKLPFMVLSLMASVLTILAQKTAAAIVPLEYVPLSARALLASKALIAYLWKMLLPVDLTPFYPYPEHISAATLEYILPLMLTAGITITCLALAGKKQLWLSVWGYYVITLLPVLGIVQVGSQAIADRYTYLPSIGPFLLAGLLAAGLYERMTALTRWRALLKNLGVAMAIVLLVAISSATIGQLGVWQNSLVFWNYIINKEHVRVAAPYYNLGNAYFSKGLPDKAIEQYKLAISLKPEHVGAHNNLGLAYNAKGMTDEAIEQYQIAVSLRPDFADAHYNLGLLYLNKGLTEMARAKFGRVLEIEPDNYSARQLLDSN